MYQKAWSVKYALPSWSSQCMSCLSNDSWPSSDSHTYLSKVEGPSKKHRLHRRTLRTERNIEEGIKSTEEHVTAVVVVEGDGIIVLWDRNHEARLHCTCISYVLYRTQQGSGRLWRQSGATLLACSRRPFLRGIRRQNHQVIINNNNSNTYMIEKKMRRIVWEVELDRGPWTL